VPKNFRIKRIFATVSGVFLRSYDTISPAKGVLVDPHTRRIEPTVRRSKTQAVSRPTIRLEKHQRHPG
jgi:hypothetical protein